jgi:hypothetical protein
MNGKMRMRKEAEDLLLVAWLILFVFGNEVSGELSDIEGDDGGQTLGHGENEHAVDERRKKNEIRESIHLNDSDLGFFFLSFPASPAW